jgi:hypothetical protein
VLPFLLAAEPAALAPTTPVTRIEVFPATFTLTSSRAEQRLGVLVTHADGRRWDHARTAKITSATPKVVTVENGIVRPVADGEGTITVEVGGKSATVSVKVEGTKAERTIEFTREIVPILTRAGCNQGACHGAALGRGGFRLSLRGFDPEFDHPQIVQSAEGRRVVLSDPERSILLQKPAGIMEHGGGERLKISSREYATLRTWLEDGAPAPTPKDPTVKRLEIWPPARVLVPGEQQQLLVRAIWSDGLSEDVTPLVTFDAINEGVAAVTPAGLVTAKGLGESFIMVRFQGQATVAQMTLPYGLKPEDTGFKPNNFIDEKLAAKWKSLGLSPSPLCNDEEFIRRLFLDAIGTLPTPEEIQTFLASQDPNKRDKLIDVVLTRPEFVDFWAYKWGDLLRINRDSLQDKGMWAFHNWVRACLRDNLPMDRMVRDIVTAEGSTFMDGPANYFQTGKTPTEWSETTVQLFLGIRIQCAKCHQHPFEKWTQEDYHGMAAFFTRMGTKNSQEFGIFGRETVVYLRPTGETNHPRTGRVVPPHPLDGPAMDDPIDRRRQLADWLTKPDNPWFARNMVNRFWAYTMGRGLVEPIDDMRATNPPSNPELLDALAEDFGKAKFDTKHLLRTIFRSRAYQLSSRSTTGNKADASNVHHARAMPKRLTAEQLADAIDYATGTREKYVGLPLGTRAIQLPDTRVRSFLMDTFGRPPRQVTCECERVSQPNIAQAMHLLNGDFINKKIDQADGRIAKLIAAKAKPEAILEEIYLVTLSRLPRPEEITWAQGWINKAPNLREGAGDLMSVLLNSREFLFNH